MPTVAYRAVRGRRKFIKAPEVKRKLGKVLTDPVKKHFVEEFDDITDDWKHTVKFKARAFITPDEISVNVFPSGPNKQIYKYVTGGTRPHIITARNAPMLAFLWGGPGSYKPKTTTAPSWGGPGSVSGGVMTFRKSVNHPGTKARNFEKFIAKKNKAWYSTTMERAFKQIIRSL